MINWTENQETHDTYWCLKALNFTIVKVPNAFELCYDSDEFISTKHRCAYIEPLKQLAERIVKDEIKK